MDLTHISSKLAGVRARIRVFSATQGLLLLVIAIAALCAASFLLDWLFKLPLGARAVALLMGIGGLGWAFNRYLLQPMRVPLRDDDVALLVERRYPDCGDELISALQLSRDLENEENHESKQMMRAVVENAGHRFRDLSFAEAVSAKPLLSPALLGAAALLVVGGYAFAVPDHAQLWFKRCVLLRDVEWPPRTRLEVVIANEASFRSEMDGETKVLYLPENSALRVEVRAEGVIPSTVLIRKFSFPRDENPTPISIEVPSRADSDTFEYKFGRVTSSFEFYVEGGDDTDERPYFRILVRSAPRIEDLTIDYDLPQYINDLGEEDRLGVREYNVIAPVGTQVKMSFTSTIELESFHLVFDDDEAQTLQLQAIEPKRYEYSFEMSEDRFYSYRLLGNNGTASRETPSFSISAEPDLPPSIGIVMPERSSIDVTPSATIPLQFLVSDDYAVGPIDIRWDLARDGIFANAVALEAEDLRQIENIREISAFKGVDVRDLSAVEEGKSRPLRPGDSVFLRLSARDTRSTQALPDPNETVYPTPLILNVRTAVEIERDLVRTQVRLKEQVRNVEESCRARLQEFEALSDAIGGEAEQVFEPLNALLAAQDIITSSLSETNRLFVRVFDGYLFNRMDRSNLTETMIAALCEAHRSRSGAHIEMIADLMPRIRRQIDDSEPMGKLTRIMDLLVTASRETSPALRDALNQALEANQEVAARRLAFDQAHELEKELHQNLLSLLDKMEEWEDFQDVIQSLKDIIELEKGLHQRLKNIMK